MRTRIVGVIMILLVVIALPAIIVLSRQQQTFQGSAHTPSPSVTASCQNSSVMLSSSYTMSDVPQNVTCQIKVMDSQNFLNDSFSYKFNQTPYSKDVDSHESTMSPGVVTFLTTCSDGFSKTNQAGYSWTKPCNGITPTGYKTPTPTPWWWKPTPTPWGWKPTPTPTKKITPTPTIKITGTVTPTLTPSVTPTITLTGNPTPTACVTPGQVTNVKVTCANCATK
jgi:hypothetical protein